MTANSALRAKLDEMVKAEVTSTLTKNGFGECDMDYQSRALTGPHLYALEAVALDLLAEKEARDSAFRKLSMALGNPRLETDGSLEDALVDFAVAELERRHDRILAHHTEAMEYAGKLGEAQARAEKAEALVAMLREALVKAKPSRTSDRWHVWINYPTEPSIGLGDYIESALSSTAPAAQEWEARIRKEEREAARQIVSDIEDDYPASVFGTPKDGSVPDCYSAAGARLACARIVSKINERGSAIMGSEWFDGPDGQSHRGEG